MRLLLDTQIALWAIADDARLSKPARRLIEAPENAIFVSTASLLEITIKHAFARDRKGDLDLSAADALGYFEGAGYEIVPILPQHALAVAGTARLHGDPFDRMLLAQANVETFRLLTCDPAIAAYGEPVLAI